MEEIKEISVPTKFQGYSYLLALFSDEDEVDGYFIKQALGARPEDAVAYIHNVSQLGEIFQGVRLMQNNANE